MRRIFALLLVLMFLVTPVLPTPAAEVEKADFSFLKAVGILDAGFNPETFYVTRAEAAMLAVRAAAKVAATDARVFTDVTAAEPYAAEIATAYKMGIISGLEDGTFRPKQSVTVNQMIKIMITLLGYGTAAQAQGGYPVGYHILANQKGLLSGVTVNGDQPLDYANMTRLMRNVLDATVAEGSTYQETYVHFADTGVSLLSAWHGIDKKEGVVTADYFVQIAANRAVRRDEIAIEGEVFHVGQTGAAALLCRRLKAYIDRKTETILYIEPRTSDEVLTIPARNVIEADNRQLGYEDENGKKFTVSISGAKLIKNGSLLTAWTDTDLLFNNGRIQIIKYGSGNATYIIAEQYINRIVDYVNPSEKTVYFRDGGSLVVDTEFTAVKTVFQEANGFSADLSYCYPWDIFSVMEGEGVLKVIRSEKFVAGRVQELSDKSVTIEGKEYPFAPGFPEDTTMTKLTLDLHADFYFDYTGALAAVDTSRAKADNYGILVGINTTKGMSPQTQVKIYTDAAKMQVFELAATVKLDGWNKKAAYGNINTPTPQS